MRGFVLSGCYSSRTKIVYLKAHVELLYHQADSGPHPNALFCKRTGLIQACMQQRTWIVLFSTRALRLWTGTNGFDSDARKTGNEAWTEGDTNNGDE